MKLMYLAWFETNHLNQLAVTLVYLQSNQAQGIGLNQLSRRTLIEHPISLTLSRYESI